MDWITILKYGVTFLGGGMAGAIFTQACNHYKNRLQKLCCAYIDDEVQSKIPVMVDGVTYENLHLKKYQLTNTTNRDIEHFTVRFVFDLNASIIDYSSHTKAGDSRTNIIKAEKKDNECTLKVVDFNRGDKVDVTLRVGNISENAFYITELDSTGFKIKMRDKRKKQEKTRSRFSEALG